MKIKIISFIIFISIIIIFLAIYYMFNNKKIDKFENIYLNQELPPKNLKILVLYVFHQYNDRVKQFIDNCIFEDDNIDFIIISNNKTNKFSYPKYVKTLFRDNIGYDFGGWSEAILTTDYTKYDNFIFVNSSVIGPFIHPNYKGKWTDIYINGLKDNVKLFGSTINAIGGSPDGFGTPTKQAHVQSYIFSVDKETLQYLIDCEIFSITNCSKTFDDAIQQKEILMSRKIIDNGWNIGSLMRHYENVDFTFLTKKPEDYNIKFLDDIMYPKYRGKVWNEYSVVFIKGNRDIIL